MPAHTPSRLHIASALLIPILLSFGMALAYVGGSHKPSPHHLPVAVVAVSPAGQVLAQRIADQTTGSFDVRTVSTVDQARALVTKATVAAAYLPDPSKATIFTASANSASAADAGNTLFEHVADTQKQYVAHTDLKPLPSGDPQGVALFFLLVALTVGAYTLPIALANAPIRLRSRLGLAVGITGVLALFATIVVDPVYSAVVGHAPAIFGLYWLYAAGVSFIGLGLHVFLGRFTAVAMTSLFVMLNVPSTGGVFDVHLQPPFFAALHSFWPGAAAYDAGRAVAYAAPGGIAGPIRVLVLWALAGLVLTGLGRLWANHARPAAIPTAVAPAAPVQSELTERSELTESAADEELELTPTA